MKRFYNSIVYVFSSFYGISRSEAIGFTILIPIMFILISVPFWYKPLRMTFIEPEPVDTLAFRAWRNQLKLKLSEKNETQDVKREKKSTSVQSSFESFYFDPNVVNKDELVKLGFDETLADRLVKYREKGGKFKSGEDLKKIYGMPTKLYERIRPFAVIESASTKSESKSSSNFNSNLKKSDNSSKPSLYKRSPIPVLEINEADTVDFERINGIGKVLASRIIRFRNALGGFLTISQVGEIYGLERHLIDSIGKYFYISEAQVRQIPINVASESTLGSHPYVSKRQAAAIVAYRIQNGEFANLEQLKNVKMVGDSTFKKILPYLKIE
jgi:competence protein ComEA